MAKLGYTFYPKDWRSSMNVYKLTLQEKGFYRELIDECFIQSSSKVLINCKTFTRINQLNVRSFTRLLAKLHESLLIVCPNFDQTLTEVEILIPSVSARLGVINEARNGGKAKAVNVEKKSAKYKDKYKYKYKENVVYYRQFKHLKLSNPDFEKLKSEGFEKDQIDSILDSIENYKKNTNYSSLYLTCLKWLRKEFHGVSKFDQCPYTNLQIREAMAQHAAGYGLPEWFDKKWEALIL